MIFLKTAISDISLQAMPWTNTEAPERVHKSTSKSKEKNLLKSSPELQFYDLLYYCGWFMIHVEYR